MKYLTAFNSKSIDMEKENLEEMLKNLDNLLISNSYKFVDSLNDKYKLDTLKKVEALAVIINISKSFKQILNFNSHFEKINIAFIEASLLEVDKIKDTISDIKTYYIFN